MNDLLTIAEAAKVLRHSVSATRRLVRHPDPAKRLPAVRVGGRILFSPESIAAFLDRSSISAPRLRAPRLSRAAVTTRLRAVAEEART